MHKYIKTRVHAYYRMREQEAMNGSYGTTCMYVCMYVRTQHHMLIYMHVYMYTYIHTHTCMHITG